MSFAGDLYRSISQEETDAARAANAVFFGASAVGDWCSDDEDAAGSDFKINYGGVWLNVDSKHRNRAYDSTVVVERWSKEPYEGYDGQIGWSLDRNKTTDLVRYVWHKGDAAGLLVPFGKLLLATRKWVFGDWRGDKGLELKDVTNPEPGGGWTTVIIIVPMDVFAYRLSGWCSWFVGDRLYGVRPSLLLDAVAKSKTVGSNRTAKTKVAAELMTR